MELTFHISMTLFPNNQPPIEVPDETKTLKQLLREKAKLQKELAKIESKLTNWGK